MLTFYADVWQARLRRRNFVRLEEEEDAVKDQVIADIRAGKPVNTQVYADVC